MADSRTHSGAAEIHPFVEDARDVASENRSGRDQATGGNSGHFQAFHDVLALLEGLCIRVSRISMQATSVVASGCTPSRSL